jgi:hypothetical protein
MYNGLGLRPELQLISEEPTSYFFGHSDAIMLCVNKNYVTTPLNVPEEVTPRKVLHDASWL